MLYIMQYVRLRSLLSLNSPTAQTPGLDEGPCSCDVQANTRSYWDLPTSFSEIQISLLTIHLSLFQTQLSVNPTVIFTS